jgi:hypothetical protein
LAPAPLHIVCVSVCVICLALLKTTTRRTYNKQPPAVSFTYPFIRCTGSWQCELVTIMAARTVSLLSLLAPIVSAIQPEAPSALAAPLRDLPWSQLNILHTTDVHGWFGGHLQECVLLIELLHQSERSLLPTDRLSPLTGETISPSHTISANEPTKMAQISYS